MTNLHIEPVIWDDYVTIDIETTGLVLGQSEILEVTYAHGLRAPITLYPEFNQSIFKNADPAAMEVNKFFDRFEGDEQGEWFNVPRNLRDVNGVVYNENIRRFEVWLDLPLESSHGEWESFVHTIKGRTIVGANPSFDMKFLESYLDDFKLGHSHRLFDIQMYAAGKFGWAKPKSFKTVVEYLNDNFSQPEIPLGDHTAERDVLSTRQVFAHLTGQFKDLSTLTRSENK